LYVPGLRLSARTLVPPWKVAVAPTTAPEADATVRLCDRVAVFVKEIDTEPALAVSVVLSNFNRPSELAARLRVLPAAGAGAAAEELVVAEEELVAAGEEHRDGRDEARPRCVSYTKSHVHILHGRGRRL